MKKALRGPGTYLLLLLLVFFLVSSLGGTPTVDKEVGYSEFMQLLENNEISSIYVMENEVKALKRSTTIQKEDFPKQYDVSTYLPSIDVFMKDVQSILGPNPADKDVSLQFVAEPEPSWLLTMLPYLLTMLLMGGLFYFMISQQGGQSGGRGVMSFGKSRAKVNTDDKNKKTFEDVAGAEEEREELAEIVDFLKNPKKFADLGARIPKGVLLVGPPGTGKTLLAKAVAGEAGVPFYSISGSDFVEMFVGVGASRVRDLFDTAKKNAPCMIFIDEIDAVGRHRGAGMGGGHDEREQTLNQLLVEMDGFAPNEGIIIIAATNRPDILDPALLRPGRFDRQITVNYPDIKGREEILKVHSKGKPLAEDVDLKVLAKRTPWFTGADLENVMNEAAILTARRGLKEITMPIILEAINRVTIGPEKKSSVVTEKDKKLVAYHEAGHALVGHVLPHCDPVHEVSIIPRGQAGGYTMTLPGEETHYVTKSKMTDDIAMMLGGRAAEELMLGEISTGASSDLQKATSTARKMVVEYGMSDAIGRTYYGGEHEVFLGRDYGQTRSYSEKVAAEIDEEIHRIIESAYKVAKDILNAHRDTLEQMCQILLEKEKLDQQTFEALFAKDQASAPAQLETSAVPTDEQPEHEA